MHAFSSVYHGFLALKTNGVSESYFSPHFCALLCEGDVGSKRIVRTGFFRKLVRLKAQVRSKWVKTPQILTHEETCEFDFKEFPIPKHL